jgi:hypothetical protein
MNGLLVRFKQYLTRVALPGSNDSPVSLKAQDLDDNFKAATLIPDPTMLGDDQIYAPAYAKDGTSLQFTARGRKVTWRELSVCDGTTGTPRTILVLASEPY